MACELRKNPAFRTLMALLAIRRLASLARARRIEIRSHPGVPHHKEMLWKAALAAGLGFRPGQPTDGEADRGGINLFWGGPTVRDADHEQARVDPRAINGAMLDSSKDHLGSAFARIFGYGLAVDPTRHTGPCVAKSNVNAAHDGRILICPTERREPSVSYQRLIDNTVDQERVLDIRVPVIGNELPFAYLKYRPAAVRFSNINTQVSIARIDDVLSRREQELIKALCSAIALDVGELDVLRDRADGRIYVVDANRMPFGPPKPMRLRDAYRAVALYAQALRRLADRMLDGAGA